MNANTAKKLNITILNANFDQPVYVDMLTGAIYEIPENKIDKKENRTTFKNIPVYDSPILIADKSILKY
jgi:6,7-dimethyl-8-ribityllumazine synthase